MNTLFILDEKIDCSMNVELLQNKIDILISTSRLLGHDVLVKREGNYIDFVINERSKSNKSSFNVTYSTSCLIIEFRLNNHSILEKITLFSEKLYREDLYKGLDVKKINMYLDLVLEKVV